MDKVILSRVGKVNGSQKSDKEKVGKEDKKDENKTTNKSGKE